MGQKVTKFDIFSDPARRPQTFCSHARTRQNIVILKKNLLQMVALHVPGLVNFGLQTPEITRHTSKFFLKNNDIGE